MSCVAPTTTYPAFAPLQQQHITIYIDDVCLYYFWLVALNVVLCVFGNAVTFAFSELFGNAVSFVFSELCGTTYTL
jgi:hypothetical protein